MVNFGTDLFIRRAYGYSWTIPGMAAWLRNTFQHLKCDHVTGELEESGETSRKVPRTGTSVQMISGTEGGKDFDNNSDVIVFPVTV